MAQPHRQGQLNAAAAPLLALTGVTLFGLWFRALDLGGVPPEMTSDHIEMLLDALRVHDGYRPVFFANNGGREAFQMYLAAFMAGPLGMGFTFATLKWATILEGVLTLPALYWMACQIVGRKAEDDRQLGPWVGVALAGLVAVSSWHLMLSRLGLRIVLTPLTAALALGFLARTLRHGRLRDALALGAVLGAGLYCYQANRLLPLVAAVPLAAARRWRPLAVAMLVTMVVSVPMYRYSRAHPEAFWSRTEGRLFGDAPSEGGRAARLWAQRGVLAKNYLGAAGMFHWRGDVAWINNAGQRPALDPIAGLLVIAGLGWWGAGARSRRDAAWWLPPWSLALMLLPSALAVAYPIENPSFTRASGALPGVFLLAALPAGWVLQRVSRAPWTVRGVSTGPLVAVLLVAGLIGAEYGWNQDNYFTRYRFNYSRNWKPYVEIAGPLRAFVASGGAFGNAFVVAYPHWLDHRILGAMAGDLRWPNGLARRDDLQPAIARNAGTPYAFDPARPLFVMFHQDDTATEAWLREQFPEGVVRPFVYSWQTGPDAQRIDGFRIFTVPPRT